LNLLDFFLPIIGIAGIEGRLAEVDDPVAVVAIPQADLPCRFLVYWPSN
jgi:hypothetical protein